MKSQVHPSDDKFSARRRLIRGSFSAPAVLTLASGSALAVQSATCLAKATATSSTAALASSPSADTFLRVQLLVRPPATSGGALRYLVTRASFGSIPVSTALWQSSTLWQRFDINTNALINDQKTSAVPTDASLANYWVALRLNSSGQIVGLGISGSGSVVGSSCWTSMAMQP